jgi:hypothetical protein
MDLLLYEPSPSSLVPYDPGSREPAPPYPATGVTIWLLAIRIWASSR